MSTVFDEIAVEERPEIDLSILPSLRAEHERVTILAVDIGTSGTRAALYDHQGEMVDGSLVSNSSEEYSDFIAGLDLNADLLIESVSALLDRAVERAEQYVSRIDYIALSCFWHSLVGIDEGGRAITPLFGWADTRAANAAAQLRAKFDETKTHARTGCRFHPSYWPAKLIWLKESPDLFGKVAHWLSFSDYLYLRLFGSLGTSLSMASATGLFNQSECAWDDEMLSIVGLEKDQLPPIAPLRKTGGGLRDEYMLRWPLLERAAWLLAIGDGAANNIGFGCVSNDQIALMLGTSGAIRTLCSRAAPALLPSELFCYRADRDRVVIGGALSDGGGLLRWALENFSLSNANELNSLLSSCEPDEHGLTILPFWSGERAPGWSLSARGTINGLRATTNTVDIVQAVMEAVAYRFALIAPALEPFAPEATVTVSGKPFHLYPVWAQIISDVLGVKIELSPVEEASLRGAALLALETIGTIGTLEAIGSEPARVFVPDMRRHVVYKRAIERQQVLYRQLAT